MSLERDGSGREGNHNNSGLQHSHPAPRSYTGVPPGPITRTYNQCFAFMTQALPETVAVLP
jgi:hypothetical protein